jgi:hypothetical protein
VAKYSSSNVANGMRDAGVTLTTPVESSTL